MTSLLSRAHARAVLALVNVAVAAVGIQIVGAKTASAPARPTAAAEFSVSQEAAQLQALRQQPKAPALSRRASAPSGAAPAVLAAPVTDTHMPIAGKGMWIWLFDQVEGGNPNRIVERARAMGLTHIYVRSSSSRSGLKWLGDINKIVPTAHRAGLRVIAWDFPTLDNPAADVARLVRVLDHRTPGNQTVDGIAVDLETPSEGVRLTKGGARYLAIRLEQLRPNRFRVLVPPRPSKNTMRFYPYEITTHFDAVAPMVYWINRHPVPDVLGAMQYLKRFGKPIAPIGQAYDARAEGGPPGPPAPYLLEQFMDTARRLGAVGVSFWSWQHATRAQFQAIASTPFPALTNE
jgi:hypothetical protein